MNQSMIDALNKAGLYLDLFETHSPRLQLHSPNCYQFMAHELISLIRDNADSPLVNELASKYTSVAELQWCHQVGSLLEKDRALYCPELHQALERIMA